MNSSPFGRGRYLRPDLPSAAYGVEADSTRRKVSELGTLFGSSTMRANQALRSHALSSRSSQPSAPQSMPTSTITTIVCRVVFGAAGHAGVLEAGEMPGEAQVGGLGGCCVRHGLRPPRDHVSR
jgi:hypothetical protein